MKAIPQVALLGALLFSACTQGPTEPQEKADYREGVRTTEAVDRILNDYEQARSLLANDETAGIVEIIGRVEATALDVAEIASGSARQHLKALASAAATGKEQEQPSLEKARSVFSAVSEHLIALIASESGLTQRRHLFECPMAEHYPKWVQVSDTVANPYMGKEMQSCGVQSRWND